MIKKYKSPIENFLHWAQERPEALFLRQPIGKTFQDYTYAEALDQIQALAHELKQQLDPNKPAHVGILSKNCAHWILSDLAVAYAGAVSVPFYPTLNAEQLNQVLVHSDCQCLIVGKLDDWAGISKGIPKEIACIHTPDSPEKSGILWSEILKGKRLKKAEILDDDAVFTIVYTSGTTGNPKGVMIPQKSVRMALEAARSIAFLDEFPTRFISYLPLCHIAERNFVEFACTASGGCIYFVESIEQFAYNLAQAQPTHFLGVPRIWLKFQEGILKKLGGQSRLDVILRIPIINNLFKKYIRNKLGLGKAMIYLTGAAPMPVDLLKWYQSMDMPIQEAYGMTENLGITTLMPRDGIQLGTVGKVWSISKVRISEEGEIQMQGEYLSYGYYKEPTLTQELFDGPWLKTGDSGSLDEQGYLRITGRIKDNFKTSKGFYVAPAPIESLLSAWEGLEQSCVIGVDLPQPLALLVLNDLGKSLEPEDLQEKLKELLQTVNNKIKKYEQLSHLVVVKDAWTVENECITPTLKIRRMNIEAKYAQQFHIWGASKEKIIF